MTRTPRSGEGVLHAIIVRSAAALDDAKRCELHSNSNAGEDSSSIGYSESGAGGEPPVKLYQGSGEDTFLSNNGQTDLGLAAPAEVATNTADSSSRWGLLSSDTPEDISLDQLTYSGDLQKDVQENSTQEGPTL